MSLVNAIVHADAAYLMADGAHWNLDGTVARIGRKMVVMPQINLVVSTRGAGGLDPDWSGWARFKTIEAALDYLVVCGQRTVDANRKERSESTDLINLAIHAVGYRQDLGGFFSVMMSTAQPGELDGFENPLAHRAEYRPFNWYSLGHWFGAPSAPVEEAFAVPIETLDDVLAWDPMVGAKQLVNAQRNQKHQMEGIGEMCLVGGFVEMAVITRKGIDIHLVDEWADEVGHRIEV